MIKPSTTPLRTLLQRPLPATPRKVIVRRVRSLHTSRGVFEPPPFRPPPIRERLRPLVPFFIWWSIITSLTVHLLRARQSGKEMQSRSEAKISVLESLLGRTRAGEALSEDEVQRQLEMVGLRERRKDIEGQAREEVRDVGWMEAIFGRNGQNRGVVAEKEDEQDVAEWARSVVAEATRTDNSSSPTPTAPPDRTVISDSSPSRPPSMVRRAPSANVYI